MDSFFEKFRAADTEDSFVVDTREEKRFIPYHQIYYFEARDKKLFVRVKNGDSPLPSEVRYILQILLFLN